MSGPTMFLGNTTDKPNADLDTLLAGVPAARRNGSLADYNGNNATANVRDIGMATGNGSALDTKAIRDTLSYVGSQAISAVESVNGVQDLVTTSIPKLYLPRGRYLIDDDLPGPSYLEIVGDDAVIVQTNNAKSHFTSTDARRWSCRGVTFVGGKSAIDIGNANIDETLYDFRWNQFVLQQDYAIKTMAQGGWSHMSANLLVRNNRFSRCNKILDNCCDLALVRACWGYVDKANFTPNSAAFRNRGDDGHPRLIFDRFFGVPTMSSGVDRVAGARWIDNYGDFHAHGARFGGEDAGMSICYHFAAPPTAFPWLGYAVSFKECWLFSGPALAPDSAPLVLKSQVPTRITMRDNLGPIGPFVVNPDGLDLDAYFATYAAATNSAAYLFFGVDIDGNQTVGPDTGSPRIPDGLRPYLVKAKQTQVHRDATFACSGGIGFPNNLVPFDTVDFDNCGGWSSASPTQLVFPPGCKRMRVTIAARVAGGGSFGSGDLGLLMLDDSSEFIAGESRLATGSGADILLNVTADVTKDIVGDFVLASINTGATGGCTLLSCTATTTPLDWVS